MYFHRPISDVGMAHARVAAAGASSTRTNTDFVETVGDNCYMV